MAIETKIEGNKLIFTCDFEEPTPSASGKTLVLATTRGNMKRSVTISGKPLTIGLNASIYPNRKISLAGYAAEVGWVTLPHRGKTYV